MSTPAPVQTEIARPGRGRCMVCRAPIHIGLLLCGLHWRKVLPPLQQDVRLALRRFWNGDIDLAALREVQQAAIDFAREEGV